jgi:hydroxymethylpyrimidine/phosphomethylpyrimidine kinase
MKNIASPPAAIALTIAGSDPSGGAGIQADLRTFAALGIHGLSAVSCTTAQVPGRVIDINPVSPEHLTAQIDLLLDTYQVAAIKTGMLFKLPLLKTVLTCLERNHCRAPLIIDPVMSASSGEALLEENAIDFFRDSFLSRASLFTPNINEASILLDGIDVTAANLDQCAVDLFSRYTVPVLLKGGHLDTVDALDVLVTGNGLEHFSAPFVKAVAPHGTGCAYSAAITACVANGHSLEQSVSRAKQYITAAIANCQHWADGHQTLNHQVNSGLPPDCDTQS